MSAHIFVLFICGTKTQITMKHHLPSLPFIFRPHFIPSAFYECLPPVPVLCIRQMTVNCLWTAVRHCLSPTLDPNTATARLHR